MESNYAKSAQITSAFEGGLSFHPKDPGGRTNGGVTQKVYDAYREYKHLPLRDVAAMENSERGDVFYGQYWVPAGCPSLPTGLDFVVFDFAINSGVARAVKELQRLVGAEVDGIMGKLTLSKVKDAYRNNAEDLILGYCFRRMTFLKGLKTWGTFGKGWERRVMGSRPDADVNDCGVVDFAFKMVRDELPMPAPTLLLPTPIGDHEGELPAKGMDKDQSLIKTAQGAGLSLAAPGVAGATVIAFAQGLQPHIKDDMMGHFAMFGAIGLMGVGGLLVAFDYLRKLKETGATLFGVKV